MTRNIGTILLCLWLIFTGLIVLAGLTFQGIAPIMGVLAIAAGILILVGR